MKTTRLVGLVLSQDEPLDLWSWIVTPVTGEQHRLLNSAFGVRKRPLEPGAVDTIFIFNTPTMYNTYLALLGLDQGSIFEPMEGL